METSPAFRIEAIPQPPGAQQNLRKAMNIDKDTYSQFTARLRLLGRDMLDTSKPYLTQAPGVWNEFINRAIEAEPSLRSFEDAWPARIYAKSWLAQMAYANFKKTGNSTTCSPGTVRRSGRVRRARSPGLWAGLTTTPPPATLAPTTSSPATPTPTTPLVTTMPPAPDPIMSAQFDNPSSMTLRMDEPLTILSLRELLQSFDPPLDHLAKVLYKTGISSSEELLAMKKWSEGQRRAFFRDDAGLSPFQAKQLDIALVRLG
ncbi:hypothetical protein NM688_g7352 [Phlebia brevispora]|uniref:Uncharacterized protein n=1 Tax=Phlebia brevispora TaxID=194682 RepID=A0ACC1S697_9APHY|nr:hypothetical protein NM688_g7352 [Phlebia brevispora]